MENIKDYHNVECLLNYVRNHMGNIKDILGKNEVSNHSVYNRKPTRKDIDIIITNKYKKIFIKFKSNRSTVYKNITAELERYKNNNELDYYYIMTSNYKNTFVEFKFY